MRRRYRVKNLDQFHRWPNNTFLSKSDLRSVHAYNLLSGAHTRLFDTLISLSAGESQDESVRRAWARTVLIQGRLLREVKLIGRLVLVKCTPYWELGPTLTQQQLQVYQQEFGSQIEKELNDVVHLEEQFFSSSHVEINLTD